MLSVYPFRFSQNCALVLEEEGKPEKPGDIEFSARSVILGHLQQVSEKP